MKRSRLSEERTIALLKEKEAGMPRSGGVRCQAGAHARAGERPAVETAGRGDAGQYYAGGLASKNGTARR